MTVEGGQKIRIKLQNEDKFVDPKKLLKKIQGQLGSSEYKVACRLPPDEQIHILKFYFKFDIIKSDN